MFPRLCDPIWIKRWNTASICANILCPMRCVISLQDSMQMENRKFYKVIFFYTKVDIHSSTSSCDIHDTVRVLLMCTFYFFTIQYNTDTDKTIPIWYDMIPNHWKIHFFPFGLLVYSAYTIIVFRNHNFPNDVKMENKGYI